MPKRHQFTPEFKARVVLEVISGAKSGAEVCREHNLKLDLLDWLRRLAAPEEEE